MPSPKMKFQPANFDTRAEVGYRFREAARKGDARSLQHYLDGDVRRVDIDAIDPHGRTALHACAAGGQPEMIEYLIDRGAGVDLHDTTGRTPLLMCATHAERCPARADVVVHSHLSRSPSASHRAAQAGHADACLALLSRGAKLDVTMRNGNTAAHLAAACGHHDVGAMLVKYGERRGLDLLSCVNARGERPQLGTRKEDGRGHGAEGRTPQMSRADDRGGFDHVKLNPLEALVVSTIRAQDRIHAAREELRLSALGEMVPV